MAISCISRSREFEDTRFCEVPDLLELETGGGPVQSLVSEHCKANRSTVRLTKVARNSAMCAPWHCEGSTLSSPVGTIECCRHQSWEASVQGPVNTGGRIAQNLGQFGPKVRILTTIVPRDAASVRACLRLSSRTT